MSSTLRLRNTVILLISISGFADHAGAQEFLVSRPAVPVKSPPSQSAT